MTMNYDQLLSNLAKSNFRRKFHLKEKDFDYINSKGIAVIRQHAYDFISKRLKPESIPNDGKQTPIRGHPVFIAQHATATCCRGCLNRWYKIEKDKELSDTEVDFVVELIMKWIEKEIKNASKNN